MPHTPTRPLFQRTCFTSQSIVSQASDDSSKSRGPLSGTWGRTSTNCPSDMKRPRTSWYATMKPSRAAASDGPSSSRYASGPYGATP